MTDTDVIPRIAAFLEQIGITAVAEPVRDDAFLPGIAIRHGGLVYDPELPYPGDLLHEAGHIAVTDPAIRATLSEVASDPGEEMAAIAWSYAAALAAGIDPEIVFHAHGYRGGGSAILTALQQDSGPGVPLLQYFGMTALPKQAEELGRPAYPTMTRWLR